MIIRLDRVDRCSGILIDMRNLFLSLAIVIASVIGSYLVLIATGVQKELAQPIASVFLGVLPIAHKALERRSRKGAALFARSTVVSYANFKLPHPVVFVYAAIATFVGQQGLSVVALGVMLWGLDEYRVNTPDIPVLPMLVPLLLVQVIVAYLVARWVGVRSGRFGFLHIFVAFGLVVSVEHSVRFMMLATNNWSAFYGAKPTFAMLIATWWSSLVMWWLIGAVGFLRGRYVRPARYANYLLRKLPAPTRSVVIDLLYDEVQRIRSSEARVSAALPPLQAPDAGA